MEPNWRADGTLDITGTLTLEHSYVEDKHHFVKWPTARSRFTLIDEPTNMESTDMNMTLTSEANQLLTGTLDSVSDGKLLKYQTTGVALQALKQGAVVCIDARGFVSLDDRRGCIVDVGPREYLDVSAWTQRIARRDAPLKGGWHCSGVGSVGYVNGSAIGQQTMATADFLCHAPQKSHMPDTVAAFDEMPLSWYAEQAKPKEAPSTAIRAPNARGLLISHADGYGLRMYPSAL